ncbi:MAG: glycogen synthase [uncultured bacterium]|nr:MAG: glycogen synthase [uncultured bacterium]
MYFYNKPELVTVWQTTLPNSSVPLYLFRNEHYLSRGDIYNSTFVWDPVTKKMATRRRSDILRYLFFSQALAHWLESKPRLFNIVHVNDWHIASLCALLKARYATANIRSLLTIHNVDIGWRGVAKPMRIIGKYLDLIPAELRAMIDWRTVQKQGYIRIFELGIAHADMLCTVSKQYAKELLTPYYGKGLEKLLRTRRGRFYPVLNGIDTAVFNPATDPYLIQHYSIRSLTRRTLNKVWLQKRLNFTSNPQIPLLGIVSRVTDQKGFELLLDVIPKLKSWKVQCVIAGVGDKRIEKALKRIQRLNKKWFYFHHTFDIKFSQRIYAGSDMFLMPSYYEPCGLSQLIAMRYGSVPIVHATGGLKDTVSNGHTGFAFAPATADKFAEAINTAVKIYRTKPKRWLEYVKTGMTTDHSWNKSASEYIKLYHHLLY